MEEFDFVNIEQCRESRDQLEKAIEMNYDLIEMNTDLGVLIRFENQYQVDAFSRMKDHIEEKARIEAKKSFRMGLIKLAKLAITEINIVAGALVLVLELFL